MREIATARRGRPAAHGRFGAIRARPDVRSPRMVIERDRYLDDSSEWHLVLRLQSRTLAAHSLLTALADEDRRAVAAILTRALDDIATLLRRTLAADDHPAPRS